MKNLLLSSMLALLPLIAGCNGDDSSVSAGVSFALSEPMVSAAGSSDGLFNRIVTGDLNSDGYPDIAAAHGFREVGLFLSHGDGSFDAEKIVSEPWWNVSENIGATSITLGDLDLDGNLDMVIPIYGDHYVGQMIQLYRGLGDGTFEFWPVDGYNAVNGTEGANQDGVNDGVIASNTANPMFAGISDVNSDGRDDVVASGNNGGWLLDVLVQSVSQEFSVSDSEQAGQNPQFFDLGDFNEDGYPDVVVGALLTGVLVFINEASSTGSLQQFGGTYLSSHYQYVIVGDFNGDDHDDIVARGNQSTTVHILFGDGTGDFPETQSYSVSGIDGYLAGADMDNDGDKDLVIASTSTEGLDILLNDGAGNFDPLGFISLDAAPWGVAIDDFDMDGYMDIVVSRNDDTTQLLWNNGGY